MRKEPSWDAAEAQWISQVSWKYCELTPTPGCSGPAPTFIPFYSVYSTPCVSSTMPEMTPFHCPWFSCPKKFTSDSWRQNHIKLHHHEDYRVAHGNNLTIWRVLWHVEPAQYDEFNANNDLAEDLDNLLYLQYIEKVACSESQPPPLCLQQTHTYHDASPPLSDYIAEPWDCYA